MAAQTKQFHTSASRWYYSLLLEHSEKCSWSRWAGTLKVVQESDVINIVLAITRQTAHWIILRGDLMLNHPHAALTEEVKVPHKPPQQALNVPLQRRERGYQQLS